MRQDSTNSRARSDGDKDNPITLDDDGTEFIIDDPDPDEIICVGWMIKKEKNSDIEEALLSERVLRNPILEGPVPLSASDNAGNQSALNNLPGTSASAAFPNKQKVSRGLRYFRNPCAVPERPASERRTSSKKSKRANRNQNFPNRFEDPEPVVIGFRQPDRPVTATVTREDDGGRRNPWSDMSFDNSSRGYPRSNFSSFSAAPPSQKFFNSSFQGNMPSYSQIGMGRGKIGNSSFSDMHSNSNYNSEHDVIRPPPYLRQQQQQSVDRPMSSNFFSFQPGPGYYSDNDVQTSASTSTFSNIHSEAPQWGNNDKNWSNNRAPPPKIHPPRVPGSVDVYVTHRDDKRRKVTSEELEWLNTYLGQCMYEECEHLDFYLGFEYRKITANQGHFNCSNQQMADWTMNKIRTFPDSELSGSLNNDNLRPKPNVFMWMTNLPHLGDVSPEIEELLRGLCKCNPGFKSRFKITVLRSKKQGRKFGRHFYQIIADEELLSYLREKMGSSLRLCVLKYYNVKVFFKVL